MGEVFSQERGAAVCRTDPQNFLGVGDGKESPRARVRGVPAYPPVRGRSFAGKSCSKLPPFFAHFRHCFPAVAGVTQALEVIPISKHLPAPSMVADVVHVGGWCPYAASGAFPAEGLPQELGRAEIIRPELQRVPAPPYGRLLGPGCALRLVIRAPAFPGQCAATWMAAGPQWF